MPSSWPGGCFWVVPEVFKRRQLLQFYDFLLCILLSNDCQRSLLTGHWRNGFKWTVAGIRNRRKKRRQWWPDFCRGSNDHNWGWIWTGSFGKFVSIGQDS